MHLLSVYYVPGVIQDMGVKVPFLGNITEGAQLIER